MQGQYKICPRCQQSQALNAAFCTGCGRQFKSTNPMPSAPLEPVKPRAKTDLCAVSAFACAIAGFWLWPIYFGPAAIVLAIVARVRISDSEGRLKGYGYSIAGGLLGTLESWLVFQELAKG